MTGIRIDSMSHTKEKPYMISSLNFAKLVRQNKSIGQAEYVYFCKWDMYRRIFRVFSPVNRKCEKIVPSKQTCWSLTANLDASSLSNQFLYFFIFRRNEHVLSSKFAVDTSRFVGEIWKCSHSLTNRYVFKVKGLFCKWICTYVCLLGCQEVEKYFLIWSW